MTRSVAVGAAGVDDGLRRIDDACGGNSGEKKAAVEALHQASRSYSQVVSKHYLVSYNSGVVKVHRWVRESPRKKCCLVGCRCFEAQFWFVVMDGGGGTL